MKKLKSEIRKQVLTRRDAISPEDRAAKSVAICKQLISFLEDSFNTQSAPRHEPEKERPAYSIPPRSDVLARGIQDNKQEAKPTPRDNGKTDNELSGTTIAVYGAMKSEVMLNDFLDYAYESGACLLFPCMTKIEDAHSAEALKSRVLPEKLMGNISQTERLQHTDTNHETRTNVSRETFCNPSQKTPSSYMVFREVSFQNYAAQHIPFAENPLHAHPIDDPELEEFPIVGPDDIDIVIVPMVAFDSRFDRLGYGGGNYDRFLPRLRNDAVVVGVAFEEQRVEKIPTDEFDQPLPLIISA